ncbi:hypothetical protein SO802_005554 [Lithocarpus litseifolius]|uniref:Uncharacterized protein n=1 Tax=Lithocarpus litseifolius TaxID=425828 RepID=A0AAW2DP21_9ROSI
METTKDREGGLLNQILPPRLEDAGLEDCALPPDSIKEAFLRAATAVKSRASSIFATDLDDDEGNCVEDPWTTAGANDTLVGLSPEHEDEADSGPCAKEKGNGVPEVCPDDVVVGGEAEKRGSDVVVVVGGGGAGVRDGGGKACVEGLQGLKIGEEVKNGGNDEQEGEKKPTLTEGFV